jgi:hypothetical protein
MKVLLVFPQKDRQTGWFIYKAFVQLGCQVEVVDAKTEPQNMLPKTKGFKPDLIFCSRTPALSEGMNIIRQSYPKIITACWNVDKVNAVKEFGPVLLQLFNSVHLLYTVGKGNIEDYKQKCPNTKVLHLQQGCDPETHRIEKLTAADHVLYDCDAMFAGYIGNRTGRKALFSYLGSKIILKLYGKETKNFITDSQHNKACLCSKVVLGHNSWPTIAISMSVRDYKVMGAGGFLLTERCPEIETWFKIGTECEVYSTNEEALEKINYYLKNTAQRQKIAQAGHQVVHARHKYIDRIRCVLEDVNNEIKCL